MFGTSQPKEEEEKMSATSGKKMSGTSQPKDEEKMSATSQRKKEKKMSATSEPFLMDDDRTLVEVTFARAHRITTTVTHSDVVARRWIGETAGGCSEGVGSNPSQRIFVGLEVACQPDGKIVLLQLCVSNRCLIYRLLHRDRYRDHDGLFLFLMTTRYCFVGAGLEVVACGLRREHGLFVSNAIDLGEAAATTLGREDLRLAGLERLAREVMRVEMDTPPEVRRSEWRRRDLSHEQIACACARAFASFELGRILVKQS